MSNVDVELYLAKNNIRKESMKKKENKMKLIKQTDHIWWLNYTFLLFLGLFRSGKTWLDSQLETKIRFAMRCRLCGIRFCDPKKPHYFLKK